MIKELKFIHITKTAGTAIENLANENGILWGRFDNDIKLLTHNIKYIINNAFWHVPTFYYDYSLLHKLLKKYDFFLVVRNPYERVISEFFCKWGGHQSKHYKKDIPINNKKNINLWIYKQLKKVYSDITNNIKMVHGHWTPQYYYLFDSHLQRIIKKKNIIHFENINNELHSLFINYNYNINIINAPKINVNKYDFNINDLNKKNLKLIYKIYKNDFKYLNYQKIL
jgi:hypothetical protein